MSNKKGHSGDAEWGSRFGYLRDPGRIYGMRLCRDELQDYGLVPEFFSLTTGTGS